MKPRLRPLSALQRSLLHAAQRDRREQRRTGEKRDSGNLRCGVDGWSEDDPSLPRGRVAAAIKGLIERGYADKGLVTGLGAASFAEGGKLWGAFLSQDGARITVAGRGQPRRIWRDSKVSLLGLVVRAAVARSECGEGLNIEAKRIRRVLLQLHPELERSEALDKRVDSVRKAIKPQAPPNHDWQRRPDYDFSFSDDDVRDFFGKYSGEK